MSQKKRQPKKRTRWKLASDDAAEIYAVAVKRCVLLSVVTADLGPPTRLDVWRGRLGYTMRFVWRDRADGASVTFTGRF